MWTIRLRLDRGASGMRHWPISGVCENWASSVRRGQARAACLPLRSLPRGPDAAAALDEDGLAQHLRRGEGEVPSARYAEGGAAKLRQSGRARRGAVTSNSFAFVVGGAGFEPATLCL